MAGYRQRIGAFIKWDVDALLNQVQSVCEVDSQTGCLLWRYRTWRDHNCDVKCGYPSIMISGEGDSVARWVLRVTTGEVGQVARHTCDRMCCVNRDHLTWGTHADNVNDSISRGRRAHQRGTLALPNNNGDNHWTRRFPEKIKRGDDHWARRDPERATALFSGDHNGMRLHPEKRPRGERHGKTKLTEADVREIRRMKAEGVKLAVIAKRFDISYSSAKGISGGVTWKHV